MNNQLRVEVQEKDGALVIIPSGELDLASSPALEQELERAAGSDAAMVILDLRQLEFMDSTGLSVLIRAQQQTQAAGRRFGVVKGTSQVQRLLDLTGVADRLLIVDTPQELLGDA